jgi:hypothetical protein
MATTARHESWWGHMVGAGGSRGASEGSAANGGVRLGAEAQRDEGAGDAGRGDEGMAQNERATYYTGSIQMTYKQHYHWIMTW